MGEENQINAGVKDSRPFWKKNRWWVVAFLLVVVAVLLSREFSKPSHFVGNNRMDCKHAYAGGNAIAAATAFSSSHDLGDTIAYIVNSGFAFRNIIVDENLTMVFVTDIKNTPCWKVKYFTFQTRIMKLKFNNKSQILQIY